MPIKDGFHYRGYLPHFKVEGATYFVTFRLTGSLPWKVVLRLKEQRDEMARRAAETEESSEASRAAAANWYATEIDSVLDQHLGENWLREPRIADLVANALRHFEEQRYQLPAWCVMPNHVHAVVRPLGDHALDEILRSWKSYIAHTANRLMGRAGPFWQRESYDHRIRDQEELAGFIRYTEMNPVKARLCSEPSDWPWCSAGVPPASE